VYQVGINKGIILRCTAYQISRFALYITQNVINIQFSMSAVIKHTKN